MDHSTPLTPTPRTRLSTSTIWACVVLAIVLSLPSLDIGFFLDDYHQIALIEGRYDFDRPALNLYESFLEFPDVPWWTSGDARTGFWRPLSSGLLHLDYRLFGRNPLPWHIHSLLWLAALILVAGSLFRRLPKTLGTLALFFFALDESHAITAGVLCNRHALVTAVIALTGLWAYLRRREDGWQPGKWLAPMLFAIALGFGETAIPAMAYALAYELFVRKDALLDRLTAIAPTAGLAAAYVLAYAVFELGPRGVVFYLNPLAGPAEFSAALALHIPALLAGGLTALPASLWMAGPPMTTVLVTVGLVVSAAAGFWTWRAREVFTSDDGRLLPMWILGSLGALPALASAPPSDRQLLVPALGISVFIAWIIEACRQRFMGSRRIGRWATAGAGATLLLLHVVIAGAGRLQAQLGTAALGRQTEAIAADLRRLDEETDGNLARRPGPGDGSAPMRCLVAFAPDFFTTIYAPVIWDHQNEPRKLSWNVITTSPVRQLLVRTADRTLEARSLDGRYLRAGNDRFFALDESLHVNGGVVQPSRSTLPIDIEILETASRFDDDSQDDYSRPLPTRLRFTVESSLDNWHLLTWRNGKFVKLDMPAIGETITVEPYPGLMATL